LPAPTKLMVGRMTSSPGLMSQRCIEENNPSLQQFVVSTLFAVEPTCSAHFFSNSLMSLPFPIQLESKTSLMRANASP
jgi:hypothetical protein